MLNTTTTENLKREMGPLSIALTCVSVMVGTGIFVLPAVVSEGIGAAAVLAYVACGILVFLLALCFAEVGSNTSKSGGPYTYIEEAFGPYAGFLGSGLYLFGAMASDAALVNALTDTLQLFIPGIHVFTIKVLFQFCVFVALAWLNIRSVKNGVRFVMITSIGKLVPLIALTLIAMPHVHPENLRWIIQPDFNNIGAASLVLFFAFLGFEAPLSNGGEIKNPSRSVPLGIFMGVSLVLVLYISIQLVTQGVLGNSLQENKEAPLGAVAKTVFGNPGMIFIIVVTAISILGSLGGEILTMPRIMFATARDGLFPKALAIVHPRFATPFIAIIIYSGIDFILAVSGSFKQLAIIASATILVIYLGVALASIRLRRMNKETSKKGFIMPGGITIPLLATIAIIWLLLHLTKTEFIGISIFILLFTIVYLMIKEAKRKAMKNLYFKSKI
ncbi:MAG: amino acid permease [Bacteroidetes bacterium]|nr:amino acid permease [Bacteroidota bacterium]